MNPWASQPRQPLIGLAAAAMLGISLADRWPFPTVALFIVTAVTALLAVWRPRTLTVWLFCAAFFCEWHTLQHWDSDARWLATILNHGPRVIHATGIVTSEPERPTVWSGNITCRFTLNLESISLGGHTFRSHAPIHIDWAGDIPTYGDRLTFTGGATNLSPARNPGEFDTAAYQQRRGIYSEIHVRFKTDAHIDSHGHGNRIMAFALIARQWMQKRLELDLADSPELTAVIDGVVLGLRGESPEDLKVLLQRTGTIHLFVVSGLNIAMLAMMITFLLRLVGTPRALRLLLTIGLLIAYAIVTGLRTSTTRSTIMAVLFLTAALFDRRALSYNNLAAAALGLLLWNSEELFTPGFQFSFTLVFIIIALTGPLSRKLESIAAPDSFLPRDLWSVPIRCRVWCWHRVSAWLGIAVASWIGSLVFTVGYFHLFSPGSVVANFLAVPVAFTILSLGLASLLTASLSTHAVVLFNNANWFAAKIMLWVLHFAASIPGGFHYVETPRLTAQPRCELTILDLGEGASAHIRAGSHDWLFDCGDDPRYNRVVLPYLRSRGINSLEGLLFTHGESRHLKAGFTAVTDFQPRLIADSMLSDKSPTRKNLHDTFVAHRIGKGLYARGDLIHFGKAATARILFPPLGFKANAAADKALVLQLQAGNTRVLLMSDSGFKTEQWLLENEPDLRSDILIKGQHPRELSGTPDFLARVQPQLIICGALGYAQPIEPLDTWTADASSRGSTVFRQDKSGAVQIEIHDDHFEARGFLNGQTFRGQAR